VQNVIARRWRRVSILVLAGLMLASPAYAYLDPSTGSMLISALIGIVAATALAVKMFWYRMVGLVRSAARRLRRPTTDEA
jgi:Na+/proline symporter